MYSEKKKRTAKRAIRATQMKGFLIYETPGKGTSHSVRVTGKVINGKYVFSPKSRAVVSKVLKTENLSITSATVERDQQGGLVMHVKCVPSNESPSMRRKAIRRRQGANPGKSRGQLKVVAIPHAMEDPRWVDVNPDKPGAPTGPKGSKLQIFEPNGEEE